MALPKVFDGMIGKWEGSCRTWFQPDTIADESPVAGEIRLVLGGRFLRHVYTGSMQGNPRHGEELIAWNGVANLFEVSWVDDFHMGYGILFSRGGAREQGFAVQGDYDVGDGQPKWAWRTEYVLVDPDHLTITAYNLMPGRPEAKAVETTYRRIGK